MQEHPELVRNLPIFKDVAGMPPPPDQLLRSFRSDNEAQVAAWLSMAKDGDLGMLLIGPGGTFDTGVLFIGGTMPGSTPGEVELYVKVRVRGGGYRGVPLSVYEQYVGGRGTAFGLTRLAREAKAATRSDTERASLKRFGRDAATKIGRCSTPTLDRNYMGSFRSRDGQWDMGHLRDNSYEDLRQQFIDGNISWEQFLDEYNNPANYRPEARGPNRSRRHQ